MLPIFFRSSELQTRILQSDEFTNTRNEKKIALNSIKNYNGQEFPYQKEKLPLNCILCTLFRPIHRTRSLILVQVIEKGMRTEKIVYTSHP